MHRNSRSDRLLRDVLAEGAESAFRDSWLRESSRLLRRHRSLRRIRLASIVVASIIAGVFLWQLANSPGSIPESKKASPIPAAPYTAVTSHPLSAAHIVTSFKSAAIVDTARGAYRNLSDAQLLALADRDGAILIKTDRNSANLIMPSRNESESKPDDQI
jgi:hypothetical protein